MKKFLNYTNVVHDISKLKAELIKKISAILMENEIGKQVSKHEAVSFNAIIVNIEKMTYLDKLDDFQTS